MPALALILAAACSGGAPDATGGSGAAVGSFSETDALQSDGSLRGVALTGHVDRSGPAIQPTLTFTSDDTEATAVIGLGDVPEGSTLTVTWYGLTGVAERDLLFSHEIAVGPGGRAFSQGIAAGGLAPGMYETVATMGDQLVHRPWVVREAGAAPTDEGLAPAAVGAGAESGDESWNVPDPGESWWDDGGWDDGVGPPPAQGPPLDTCTLHRISAGRMEVRYITASAWLLGPCSTATLTATVSGPP